ncbi:MAG: OmpA family protein, partial [Gemmatimonadota bacterium]|nr:OmpA family protein [Gemmatimonadota bacterium]
QVRSADAVALVRIRASRPMEDRAVIGKVWVDLNGDGTQQAGEGGIAGVDIWTDDGEISTTDAEGRFSFRNIRPGQHGFRLDPVTLPSAFRVAGDGTGQEMVTRDATGWTTPRVDFRLLPREGRIASVRLPFAWSAALRPDSASAPEPEPEPAPPVPAPAPPRVLQTLSNATTLRRQAAFEFAQARVSTAGAVVIGRVADTLNLYPEMRVEIGCHTDSIGTRAYNLRLSMGRAESVKQILLRRGVDSARLELQGYGPDRPVASNATKDGQALNRRCEITVLREVPELGAAPEATEIAAPTITVRAPARPMTRLEVNLRNGYAVPLDGLVLRFPMELDYTVLGADEQVVDRGRGPVMRLPPVPAGSELRVAGIGDGQAASAVVLLERNGRVLDRAELQVSDSAAAVPRVIAPEFTADSLPDPAALPAGGTLQVVLAPPVAGWPGGASFPMPSGWEVAADRLDGAAPTMGEDRSGAPVLFWPPSTAGDAPLLLPLRPAGAAMPVEAVRIPLMRPPAERAAEAQRAFLDGPAISIFSPGDGVVLPSDRVYVGVRGEPGAPIALFDGDSLIGQANLRIDGVHDFIAIPLAPGPHRLRVSMQNSSSRERWDSIAVHVTGAPARFTWESVPVSLVADGNTEKTVRVRVTDRFGVPVTNRPEITVAAVGAEPVNADANASSVGIQVAPDSAGWLTLRLRAGRKVAPGRLRLGWSDVHGELAFDVLPASQALLIAGVGRVGMGATPDAFGAMTVRGRLDPRTSIVMSYDSRRLDAGRDAFGRVNDPLEEAQYPILGDASAQRTHSASRYALAARVERGFDWLALGDVSTTGFGSELRLSGYRRALPGAAGRVTTGAVTWQGFGSSTSQVLRQLQVRGAGISGPYDLGANIRDGTEQVALEVRAEDNATRVISRQVLERFVDYQIDYLTGTLLLKQPVPAADTYGNPVFIVVLYEAESGGPRSQVWGLRGLVDANRFLQSSLMDSLRVGATVVNESPNAGGHRLIGADVRLLKLGAVEFGGEVSRSQSADSAGTAASVDGAVTLLGGAARLSTSWMTAGREFGNPANPAL